MHSEDLLVVVTTFHFVRSMCKIDAVLSTTPKLIEPAGPHQGHSCSRASHSHSQPTSSRDYLFIVPLFCLCRYDLAPAYPRSRQSSSQSPADPTGVSQSRQEFQTVILRPTRHSRSLPENKNTPITHPLTPIYPKHLERLRGCQQDRCMFFKARPSSLSRPAMSSRMLRMENW
ncbi:hypothetical protein BDZ89DRAFT_439732 [Hymenopellis radicata]|nr:hypothetical protein BDZ89DRAFT_439732 [Hymenopellis radicata]